MEPLAHDGHVHITSSLAGSSASAADLIADMDDARVGYAAVVTPGTAGWDNTLTYEAVASAPDRLVPIVRVDMRAENAVELLRLAASAGAVGVRITTTADRTLDWLFDAHADAAADVMADASLVAEFHAEPDQLTTIGHYAEAHPDLRILIDHMGRPAVPLGVRAPRFQDFLNLAAHPNVYAKTANSSYFSRESTPYNDIAPFLRAAIDAFGPHRIMWSSDWPSIRDAGAYSLALEPTITVVADMPSADAAAVLKGTFEELLFRSRR